LPIRWPNAATVSPARSCRWSFFEPDARAEGSADRHRTEQKSLPLRNLRTTSSRRTGCSLSVAPEKVSLSSQCVNRRS
jgi:hypothetical protein